MPLNLNDDNRMEADKTRINEWFVPKFGPVKFRAFIGLLFLPYTGMCVSFALTGSMIHPTIDWVRVWAIGIIYFFALGLSAHCADALGSKGQKPWGKYFSKLELKIMMILGLVMAYSIGVYYMIFFTPMLWPIAILEGFFVFAYNFELVGGFFHHNFWFAVSWGSLPFLAGYIMQANSYQMIILPLLGSIVTFVVSYIEIRISREYKEIIKNNTVIYHLKLKKLEATLKILSLCTIIVSLLIIIVRYITYSS